MNTRNDKIELIKAIANGEIEPENLSRESVLISDGKEVFTGLMISVNSKKAGKKDTVVYIGEAKKAVEEVTQNIIYKRNGTKKPK